MRTDARRCAGAGDWRQGDQVRAAATAKRTSGRRAASARWTDTISFGALKTERTTFGSIVDHMFQDSIGERSPKSKDEVAAKISAIETRWSAQMQQAAIPKARRSASLATARCGLVSAWPDEATAAPTAGVLRDANADQPWVDTPLPTISRRSEKRCPGRRHAGDREHLGA